MSGTLDKIRAQLALCDEATDGPWIVDHDGCDVHVVTKEDEFVICEHAGCDATFIASARMGYPAALRALRDVIDNVPGSDSSDYDQGYKEAMLDVRRIIARALEEVGDE